MPTYRRALEDHLVCCLLIETCGAVEAIEEICAVPGIDAIVPARFDLSTALGVSGQFDHPDFVAAVARVERAALAAGCRSASSPSRARRPEDHRLRHAVAAGAGGRDAELVGQSGAMSQGETTMISATIIGAGSVGLGVAASLAVAGQRVTLLAREGAVAALREAAITVSGLHGEHALPAGSIAIEDAATMEIKRLFVRPDARLRLCGGQILEARGKRFDTNFRRAP